MQIAKMQCSGMTTGEADIFFFIYKLIGFVVDVAFRWFWAIRTPLTGDAQFYIGMEKIDVLFLSIYVTFRISLRHRVWCSKSVFFSISTPFVYFLSTALSIAK